MAARGGSRNHPCYRAIQHNMEQITQTVVYNDIKDKVFAKELITLEDLEEYDKLTSNEAVRKMIMKVMHSTTTCEEFLKILHEMQQPHYKQLAEVIAESCKQNSQNTQSGLQLPVTNGTSGLQLPVTNDTFRIISEDEFEKVLEESQIVIDTSLKDEEMVPIVKNMRLQRHVSKGFTEFLMYIIKLFREAIENKTICLKDSVKENILKDLNQQSIVLKRVWKDFCGTDDETSLDNSIAIVVTCAIKVKDIIKSLQKKHWLRWFRSAKNISALVPIFEKITKVMKGIQNICCRKYSELLGDVVDLKASLNDIHKRIFVSEAAGLSTGVILAVGGFISLLVGGILFCTPAAPAGVPLAIAGGAAVGAGFMIGGGTKLYNRLAMKYLDHSEVKGTGKGQKLVKNTDNFKSS